MIKKTRLPFSSLSIEGAKEQQGSTQRTSPRAVSPNTRIASQRNPQGRRHAGNPDKKRTQKSSTYQYSKGGHGGRGGNRPFNAKNISENKIPLVEEGTIRIIPLGGVEEVGRNMILIE